MEDHSCRLSKEDETAKLPPGFRFHPTDEELITHYLSQKVVDRFFTASAIGEVDLNKVEPWDLPSKAKMGVKEWYFFTARDRKYPTGLRTNRATEAGYWKATGKDKEIFRAKTLIGMKKTLVFYKGRAPKGHRANWVMHEYRLEGKHPMLNYLPQTAKIEWVICRVFKKRTSGEKTTEISEPARVCSYADELQPPLLPPLTESSERKSAVANTSCFSFPMENNNYSIFDGNYNPSPPPLLAASSSSSGFPPSSVEQNLLHSDSSILMRQDQSILRLLLEGNGSDITSSSYGDVNVDLSSAVSCREMMPRALRNQEIPSTVVADPVDLDSLLNY
ncbi:hypothetical protein Nepgr_032056 [Nepenthes gracilis]|uniref:NAC domain-containing protein n=1 Tax=Nepenthes gracilis TaxID=150966 RepID=A0AAD3THW5_NEPGR|nr:hypothetical protein Nepgr_032056 [Nepenthes gracilis]